MSHCSWFARRLSRNHPAAWCLAALVAGACNWDNPVAPDLSSTAPDVDSLDPTSSDTGIVIVTDSIGDGIDSTLAAAETGTTIYPGQDVQAKVNQYPGGTTFQIKAGIHRLQSIVPKNGNSFVGEPGAILSGARLLTAFTKSGGYWIATGQTQQGNIKPISRNFCLPNRPGCFYPEQLFINNALLQHVTSLAAVAPGKWYFDYAADKIYIANDPTGKKVETSVKAFAFKGYASNVTISGLTVEKYATPPSEATIDGQRKGAIGWIVKDNEVRWNQGRGIRSGDRMQILRNYVHHQGQTGIAGAGDNVLVQDNEVAYNNTAGFTSGWEAAGMKFFLTNGLTVRGNFSHHNDGNGLHCDIDCINTLIENNRVEDNNWRGIFYEISYKGTIRNNVCRRNGFKPPRGVLGPVDHAGILISNSRDVEVFGNTIENNWTGIGAYESNRGSGEYGVHDLVNLNVHDNTVVQSTGRAAGVTQSIGSNAVFKSQNNKFTHNNYDLGSSARYFHWMNGERTTSEWKGYGLDLSGSFR
jgi:parallel beta-helix repeat protein